MTNNGAGPSRPQAGGLALTGVLPAYVGVKTGSHGTVMEALDALAGVV
jgi:hypothetical protein